MAAADYIQVAQQLYLAYFGRPADRSGLINMTNALNAAGAPTTAQGIADAYGSKSNATVVAILDNFGASDESKALYGSGTDTQFIAAVYQQVLNRLPDLEGLDFWTAALGNGSMTRANAATQIIAAALKDGGDATDAATVSNKVTVSTNFTAAIDTVPEIIGYSGDTAAAQARALIQAVTDTTDTAAYQATVESVLDSIANPVVPGQTFALTTGADLFLGTSNNDTFNAGLSSGTATLDGLDSLNGGAGTDTLNLTLAGATVQPASLTNVENIVLNGAGGTLSLLGSTGVTSLTAQGTTANTSFNSIGSTATALKVSSTSSNTTFAYTAAAVAGTEDSATLTLQNVTGGTQTIAGIETLNIVSSGSANATTLVTADATKYVISGDQNLTLGTVAASVVTVDASALTGVLSVTTGGAASTVTGGAGNDAITLSAAVNDVIDGGAGNDTIVTAGFLTTGDTLTGGAGTDVLSGTSANLTGTYTKITGFETLTVTNALAGNLTTANVNAGVETVNLTAGAGAFTVAFETGSKTLNLGAANTGALTVSSAGTGTADAVTVKNAAAATSVFATNDLIATGVETLTVNGTGTGAATTQVLDEVTVTASTGGTATVNFTGSNAFTTGVITAGVIDASGLTGDAVLTMGAAAASGLTKITGSAGADTLLGDAASSIDGGAGNDTVTGGTGNDTLVGGDGADTITSNTGSDSILGGAGNDTLVLGSNFTTGDVVDGGDGVDTLSLTSATSTGSLNVINALSFSAVGALNEALSNVERITISDALVIDGANFDMARLDSINYVTFAGGLGTAAEEIIGVAANSTFVQAAAQAGANATTLTLGNSSGSADVINLGLINATDTTTFGAITLSGVETVNVDTAEVTETTNHVSNSYSLTLNLTGANTVNVTGTENITLAGTINATTINASGNTGFIVVTGGSANQTITGSASTDTINGGTGADTIDGGAGADVLLGGTGADAITGGNGADTITGGTGNDTITLTETTAAADDVVINYSEAGASVDTIVGFTTGASADELQFDISDLNSATTSGLLLAGSTLANGAGTAVTAAASVVNAITAAATLGATDSVIVLRGATFADASEVEDAIEAGGAFALTGQAGAFDTVDNTYIVVYSDGTNTHVAAIHAVAQTTDNSVFEAGDTNVIDLAIINGVASIGSSTFVAGNFEFIA